ncbi:hypothetical protein LJB98_01435 [Bacteroidales bacterium OttesenSCG-928-M11]|nr:hypothetical protein [Bacteroidales bacterium OttesenSCG-928-M11]
MVLIDSENNIASRIRKKIDEVNSISNVSLEGAWVILEILPQDYSLSQLSHLVEQNNARIMNLISFLDEETSKSFLALKLDLEDASNVVRSLERFDYLVKYLIQKQSLTDETMKNRLDELMFYLEM